MTDMPERRTIERQCTLCGRRGVRGWLDLDTLRPPRRTDHRPVMCAKAAECNRRRGRG